MIAAWPSINRQDSNRRTISVFIRKMISKVSLRFDFPAPYVLLDHLSYWKYQVYQHSSYGPLQRCDQHAWPGASVSDGAFRQLESIPYCKVVRNRLLFRKSNVRLTLALDTALSRKLP